MTTQPKPHKTAKARAIELIGSSLTPTLWNEVKRQTGGLEERLVKAISDSILDQERPLLVQVEKMLGELHRAAWKPEFIGKVIQCFLDHQGVKLESVELWIRSHPANDHEGLCDCISLLPPPHVTVLRRLPRQGSQKIVFEASWGLHQKTVILKKLLTGDKLLQREMLAHPLTIEHKNIIKTYSLRNERGEDFLVEEKLGTVLHDGWRSGGTEESALLTHDIASALCYLKEHGLVHGDVKPDNVGIDEGRFILLDFGLCRNETEFATGASATGSLRTRAPELLMGEEKQSWRSDLWALGATVTSATCGFFPLVDPDDKVPRISEPENRAKFEGILRQRVEQEYEERLQLITQCVTEPRLRPLVQNMLERHPGQRTDPEQLVQKLRQELPHAVPDAQSFRGVVMPPAMEAKAILALWPTVNSLNQMPSGRRDSLKKRIKDLLERIQNHAELTTRLTALCK